MPPPPPLLGAGIFGDVPSSSHGAARLHAMPPPKFVPSRQPHRPSAADHLAASAAASIFGPSPGTSRQATPSLTTSLGVAPTSLEASTVPENVYLTSNVWLDQR